MVSSVDGKSTTGQGSMEGLGTKMDRHVLNQLRSQVDAVLVGAETLRNDQFVPTLSAAFLEQRHPHFRPQPLGIVISKSGSLPPNHRFWQAGAELRLIFTPHAIPKLTFSAQVFNLDLGAMLDLLWRKFGVKRLLIEGGATTNFEFLQQGWGDELFLTLCPKLVGGHQNLTIVGGNNYGLGSLLSLQLRSLYSHDHELFLRYQISP